MDIYPLYYVSSSVSATAGWWALGAGILAILAFVGFVTAIVIEGLAGTRTHTTPDPTPPPVSTALPKRKERVLRRR
jgi:hypothetical protein